MDDSDKNKKKEQYEINPNLNQLSGPVSWTEFLFEDDQGNKKMIHLFGDFHDKEHLCPSSDYCASNSSQKDNPCYTFPFFLEQLFEDVKENKQTADFFLEVPYHLKEQQGSKQKEYVDTERDISKDSLLEEIYEKFRPCFQRNKSNCQYNPYVKMHYTDLRIAFQDKETLKDLEKSSYGLLGPYLNREIRVWINLIQNFFQTKVTQEKINYLNGKTQLLNKSISQVLNLYPNVLTILLTSNQGKKELQTPIQKIKEIYLSIQNKLDTSDLKEINQTLDNISLLFKNENQSILKKQLDALHQDKIQFNGQSMSKHITDFAIETLNATENVNIPKIQQMWNILLEIYKKWIIALSNANKNKNQENVDNLEIINKYLVESYEKMSFSLETLLIYLDFFVLDLYILTRMFRTFGGNPSSLSITYAGQAHIELQCEFLKTIGIKMIREIPFDLNRLNFQCLKDKDLGKAFTITKNNI